MADILIIRTMNDVFQSLSTHIMSRCSKLTDFRVGSALRTLCEAFSIQLEEFYFSMRQHVKASIEESVYSAFGFERQDSVRASGQVKVTYSAPLSSRIIYPVGTLFCTSSSYGRVYFQTEQEYYGNTSDYFTTMTVYAVNPGRSGNIPAGTLTIIVASNPVISSVTNEQAFVNGREAETETSKKERFERYLNSLARGTESALLYAATNLSATERSGKWVREAYVESSPGVATLYYRPVNDEVYEDDLNHLREVLEEYRAAGVELNIRRVAEVVVNASIVVTLKSGELPSAYAPRIKTIVENRINSCSVGDGLYRVDLMSVIKNAYPNAVINVEFDIGEQGVFEDIQGVGTAYLKAGTIDIECVNAG